MPEKGFTSPCGLFEFKVLCIDFINALSKFQNIMNDVLKDVIDKFVLVYLDDTVVFSQNDDEHMMHLKVELTLLHRHTLYVKLYKGTMVKSELKCPGHIINAKGIQVDLSIKSIVKDRLNSKHDPWSRLGLRMGRRHPSKSSNKCPACKGFCGHCARAHGAIWSVYTYANMYLQATGMAMLCYQCCSTSNR